MKIYFHNDIDGVFSAIILANHIKYRNRHQMITFIPVDYCDLPLKDVRPEDAIVDFMYHDGCGWFFDHHPTGMGKYDPSKIKGFPQKAWDPTYKSCAHLVFDHLAGKTYRRLNFRDRKTIPLIEWADKIDSAGYANIDETLDYKTPCLKIHAAYIYGGFSGVKLIKLFFKYGLSIDQVAQSSEITSYASIAEERLRDGFEAYEKSIEYSEKQNLILWDISDLDFFPNRYIPFKLYPQTIYSLGIKKRNGEYEISFSKNPWRKRTDNEINIGKALKKYGGGGHADVGGCQAGTLEEAKSVIRNIQKNYFKKSKLTLKDFFKKSN